MECVGLAAAQVIFNYTAGRPAWKGDVAIARVELRSNLPVGIDLQFWFQGGIADSMLAMLADIKAGSTVRQQEETQKNVNRDDWDQHWNEYSEDASQNPAQEYRRGVIFKLLGLCGLGAGVRLLDIGSGQGDMAMYIRAKAPSAEILGLELSQSGVEISRRKVHDARFAQCNLLEETRAPEDLRGWATHAICSEVIEHVDDPVQLLRNARDYMHPDCLLVLTAPGGPMLAFDKHIGHRKHFTTSAISDLLRQAGYSPEYAGKAGFPFFNAYRCIVILRGKKLIEDVSTERNPSGSSVARLAMMVFSVLFRMNLRSSPWGWQMVARARFIPNTNQR